MTIDFLGTFSFLSFFLLLQADFFQTMVTDVISIHYTIISNSTTADSRIAIENIDFG